MTVDNVYAFMAAAKVIDADYHPDTGRITYQLETNDGAVSTATLNKRVYGPEIELTDEQMKQLAAELPGTPAYDKVDGGMFDISTFPLVDLSHQQRERLLSR